MPEKTIVEIRAPENGAVEDVNIYNADPETVQAIAKELEGVAKTVHRTKMTLDDFELIQEGENLQVIIKLDRHEWHYDLGKAFARATFGGLAYNVYQDLHSLDSSLENKLALRPIIGLPRTMIERIKKYSANSEPDYLVPANIRKSMMICGMQLNLVTKESRLQQPPQEPGKLETPDVVIVSSYPADMTERELDIIAQYLHQNQNTRLYFNPGGNQIRAGVQKFHHLMPFFRLTTMKLDEALLFLGIPETGSRQDLAKKCLTYFFSHGQGTIILNDSENGSYAGHEGKVYHTLPFPKQPVEEKARGSIGSLVENFSGCGDAIFSAMLYASETHPDSPFQERLAFANSLARLMSLIPESNLYAIDGKLINNLFAMSKSYSQMVRKLD